MEYLVSITHRAERDLADLYEEIHAQHSGAALEWYRGLKRAILSLEHHPSRCPVTGAMKSYDTCSTAASLTSTG